MLTLIIIFLAIVLTGLSFWYFNRKEVNSLSEKLEDKDAVINALKTHVEQEVIVESTFSKNDPNDGWRGQNIVTSVPNETNRNQKQRTNRPKKNGQNNSQKSTSKKVEKVDSSNKSSSPKKNKNKKNQQ